MSRIRARAESPMSRSGSQSGPVLATLLAALIPLVAAGCGSAGADGPPVFPWMEDAVRAMPGYAIEPDTFDRYLLESHPAAVAIVLPGGKTPDDPRVRRDYIVEVHRQMLDRAFCEGRTDLADVLTRAYLAAEAGR